MRHARETFSQTLVQSADQIANKYNACCCSSRSWLASIFPSFNTIIAVIDFVQQFVQTISAKQVMLNSP